ncbi:MAG TPA: tRNA (adenosine(37)-N6)-threonylcarbamoyltransferase complex ATPase subunit type 1 TsaE [Desulfobacteraceae bacterium]|nr:tRNA (adenosine(37)-N6)-threonylcarbamoyltransferase complex ATPase subunit type 1 TsaE [Desulfobacteraceae bacterium]
MTDGSVIHHSESDLETINLGRKLGEVLTHGDVIALSGELGSGKTCFTKGISLGLGISAETVITSPSFSLVNVYEGRCVFYHMDIYRLESLSAFLSAGLDEYFYQGAVVVLEWADRWPEILPDCRVDVVFSIPFSSSEREHFRDIVFSACHPRAIEILQNMEKSGK